MARGRNRNNQGANRNNQETNRPEDIDEATDAEFLENDDQVDSQLSDEEEQVTMANDPSQQDENQVDDTEVAGDESQADAVAGDKAEVKKKGNNAVWYGVGAVLVAAAVAGIYYSNQTDDSANHPSVASQAVTEAESAPAAPVESTTSEGMDPAIAVDEAEDEQPADSNTVSEESSTDEETSASPEVSGLASSDEVVEHQTGEDVVEEEQGPEAVEPTATEDEPASLDERPAELSAIVTPEVGIGAFEQEELATGEQTPEEAASIDEPNAQTVEASEVEDSVAEESVDEVSVTEEATGEESETSSVETSSESEELPVAAETEIEADTDALQNDSELQETSELQARSEAQAQAQAQAIAAVEEQGNKVIEELEREFEVLTARQQQEIRRLQEELSGMQQHLQANNDSVDGLLLNDVSRLLQSAENELRFNGNVANAVSILTVAQRIAAESKNTMLEGLVGAIGADIVALKSNESATIEDMFRQVQQLSKLIDAAPLNTPDYASHTDLMLPKTAADSNAPAAQESNTSTTAADAKWYERTWNQTKSFANTTYEAIASDLGELVRVEKLSEPDSGLLSAEQAGIMRNNLKMQLGFAQQALMSRQQGIWQTSLMSVAESLEQYFRPDAGETQQAQEMLADLVRSSVQPAMPDISHSRRALSETYEQLRVQRSFQE